MEFLAEKVSQAIAQKFINRDHKDTEYFVDVQIDDSIDRSVLHNFIKKYSMRGCKIEFRGSLIRATFNEYLFGYFYEHVKNMVRIECLGMLESHSKEFTKETAPKDLYERLETVP